MSERKHHPSLDIPEAVRREANYRAYLRRLIPPMEVEAAERYRYVDGRTGAITDAASMRDNARCMDTLTTAYYRVFIDMGLIKV